MEKSDIKNPDTQWLPFLSIGFELLALEIAFIYGGLFLDKKYSTEGLFMVIGAVAAFFVWFVHLLYLLIKWDKISKK